VLGVLGVGCWVLGVLDVLDVLGVLDVLDVLDVLGVCFLFRPSVFLFQMQFAQTFCLLLSFCLVSIGLALPTFSLERLNLSSVVSFVNMVCMMSRRPWIFTC
jgi:hypothetical protein